MNKFEIILNLQKNMGLTARALTYEAIIGFWVTFIHGKGAIK